MGDSSDYSGNGGNVKAIMITGKIMVLAIFVLFVVVVAVLFLHLYARWFWWRTVEEEPLHDRSSRRRRRRFVFARGQDPAAATPRRGLELAVLRSIPVVVYRPEDFKEGLECAVCLCDVVEDERTRILPECNHGFHVECIDMWFQSHSTCPLCRNPVRVEYGGLNKVHGGESGRVESSLVRDELSERRNDAEASYFPVNMLIWGDEARTSSTYGTLDRANCDDPHCFFGETSSSMDRNRPKKNRALVIEIPRQTSEDTRSPLTSGGPPDNMKSPVSGRLKSFGRLLSRERKVSPCSQNSTAVADIEQGGRDTTRPC